MRSWLAHHVATKGPWLLLTLTSIAAVGLFFHAALGPLGWRKGAALRAELLVLTEENGRLMDTLLRLERQIKAEAERPDVQAQLVRDLLGYVRPNEHVLKIEP